MSLSITGGGVYRGPSVAELKGKYVYGDYLTNRFWALQYDEKLGRVTENRPIQTDRPLSVLPPAAEPAENQTEPAGEKRRPSLRLISFDRSRRA